MNYLLQNHKEYIADVPDKLYRNLLDIIDWDSRLIIVRGPKGVGKSTLMLQHIVRDLGKDNNKVLYCSADSTYFSTHTLVETADSFARIGGEVLMFDEIHKYENWSREIKEINDLHKKLKIVISGSSLIQLNDGQSDLSRRADFYDLPGLSFREYLWFRTGVLFDAIGYEELLDSANDLCSDVNGKCKPYEYFSDYLKTGYYPFSFEKPNRFRERIEQVLSYTVENELTRYRHIEVGNTRKISALLKIISGLVPFQLDVAKISKVIQTDRITLLRYLKYLDEAKIIRELYSELISVTDLQKPDKLLFDNTNILYALSEKEPESGTVRETFFCNQLASSGHGIEYGGMKNGDYRIDGRSIIEVGGPDKDFSQIDTIDRESSALAVDGIEWATGRRIPLWCYGMLY